MQLAMLRAVRMPGRVELLDLMGVLKERNEGDVNNAIFKNAFQSLLLIATSPSGKE